MSSAMAASLGMTSASGPAATAEDAPGAESGSGFLAAMDAVQPGPAATTAAPMSPLAATDQNADEAAVQELAAAVAALLLGVAAPAEEPVAAAQSAEPEAQGAMAPRTNGPATASALLNGVQLAAAPDPEAVDVPAAQSLAALADISTAETLKGEAPESPVKMELRQLLQLMDRTSATPSAVAGTADTRAGNGSAPAAGLPAALQLQPGQAPDAAVRMAATDTAARETATPVVQPGAVAPNSLLAAASADFASTLHRPPPATAEPTQILHAPVGTPRWADELGSRITLMAVRGQHEGSLTLTPENLGPVEVRISVSQNTANVWFGAQHADARAALTEALPRLREMFGAAGMTLGHAGVSQQTPRHGARAGDGMRQAGVAAANAVEGPASTAVTARRIALGLVDTYA